MSTVGIFSCHFYVLLISIDSNLNVLSLYTYKIKIQILLELTKNERVLKSYMGIRIKIKFQESFIVFPQVVYDYTCSMFPQNVELVQYSELSEKNMKKKIEIRIADQWLIITCWRRFCSLKNGDHCKIVAKFLFQSSDEVRISSLQPCSVFS